MVTLLSLKDGNGSFINKWKSTGCFFPDLSDLVRSKDIGNDME